MSYYTQVMCPTCDVLLMSCTCGYAAIFIKQASGVSEITNTSAGVITTTTDTDTKTAGEETSKVWYIDPESEGVKKPGQTRTFKGIRVVEWSYYELETKRANEIMQDNWALTEKYDKVVEALEIAQNYPYESELESNI